MKRNLMRPMMEEYVQEDNSNTQSTRPPQSFKRPQSHYDQNNLQNQRNERPEQNSSQSGRPTPFNPRDNRDNYPQSTSQSSYPSSYQSSSQITSNEQEQVEEDIIPRTSQTHKTKDKDYKINPRVIPRPNHFDEIYRNSNKEPIYETNEDIHPPFSSTYYIVNETQNSSCRFIRSTMTKIPTDQSTLNNSSLLFGLYCQPFAEVQENEREIPKVETNEQIFRCRRCNSYINSKYEMTYSKSNKPIAVCNICACENELDSSKPSVKNEYFSSNFSNVPELSCPTVDFIAPASMKHAVPFYPHYIFMIDISQSSYDMGLSAYVLNSITSNLDFIHNASGSYIAIATYDNKSIQFFAIDKNNEVKAYVVPDIDNPFCPLPKSKLFLNVMDNKSEIEKIVEKINFYISEKYSQNSTPSKALSGTSLSGAAIAAGVNALEENGGRVMVFTCNSCNSGFGGCRPKEEAKLFNTKDEKNLYMPQHNQFNKLAETCLEKRIVVDQFVVANTQYDLATFGVISDLTGGAINFYSANSKDINELRYKLEKMHYDFSRILTRPNYYDVKFMLRFSIGIDTQEILGPFNKKLGEAFQISSCDPDYSYCYNLRLSESLKNNGRYHFQLVCLYIDNFNQRYLRTFNYTIIATTDTSKIYTSADVDCLAKLTLMKEISLVHQAETNLVRENLMNKLINSFLHYRVQCSKQTPVAQLILPASIKYLPLYYNSFVKKPILKKNKINIPANHIISLMNKMMREPVYLTVKYLYPKFYRIDDIQQDQSVKFKEADSEFILRDVGHTNEKYGNITKPYMLPLSLDHIDFYCAYLADDGEFISMFIFNYINPQFYQEIFGVDSFEEAANLGVESLDENNTNDLNVRILNIVAQLRKENRGPTQPVKIYFLDDKSYMKPEFSNILIEDKKPDEPHYVDFLCGMHEEIQKKMNS